MTEKVFQAELATTFRAAGYWAMKWPDQAVSRMQVGKNGKLRFALPKPFDLILCSPEGRFVAIECKLVRGPKLAVDERLDRQVETLAQISERGGFTWLALNFRFVRHRQPQRVNRAVLFPIRAAGLFDGPTLLLDNVAKVGGMELIRTTGGWRLPTVVHGVPWASHADSWPPSAEDRHELDQESHPSNL